MTDLHYMYIKPSYLKFPTCLQQNPDFKNKIISTLLQKYLINICKILQKKEKDLQQI